MRNLTLSLLAFSLVGCATAGPWGGRSPASLPWEEDPKRQEVIRLFLEFASREAVEFGEPKGSKVSMGDAQIEHPLYIGERRVGTAEFFQRCVAKTTGEEKVVVSCYPGVTGSVNGRDLSIDPDLNSGGKPMRLIGKVDPEVHLQALSNLIEKSAPAQMALARAMKLNGCKAIELGDVEGQVLWIDRSVLGDEDTGEVFPDAKNIWRATFSCRVGSAGVYLDFIRAVEGNEIHTSLRPVKAELSEPILIEKLSP